MIRFSTSLYLGIRHPSRTLGVWEGITTGAPAAFAEPPLVAQLESELAELTGCAAAALAPSTLHVFWDLFDMIAAAGHDILLDSGAYEVARWGAERAACRGALVRTFASHDAAGLRELACSRRPVAVVADGMNALTGRPAPLDAYTDVAQATDGVVIVDDTQAMGLLGQRHGAGAFGAGGGGSVRWHALEGRPVVLVASLAKAFGAPLTVIAGSEQLIRRFKERSRTRLHCSPPSIADLASARRALRINRRCGDGLRARLERNIRCFRACLRRHGLSARGGLFPAQTLNPIPGLSAHQLHARLAAMGIETVLRSARGAPRVCFIITASHTPEQLSYAVAQVAAALPAATLEGVVPCHAS